MKKLIKTKGWIDEYELNRIGYGDKKKYGFYTTDKDHLHIPKISKTRKVAKQHDPRFVKPKPIKVEIIIKII